MKPIHLYTKIDHLPSDLQSEVNDFIESLLIKRKNELKNKQPKFGCAKGQIYITPDFDAPLEDFKDYM